MVISFKQLTCYRCVYIIFALFLCLSFQLLDLLWEQITMLWWVWNGANHDSLGRLRFFSIDNGNLIIHTTRTYICLYLYLHTYSLKLNTPLAKLASVVLPQRSLLARAKLSPLFNFFFICTLYSQIIDFFLIYVSMYIYICLFNFLFTFINVCTPSSILLCQKGVNNQLQREISGITKQTTDTYICR